jgi:hypothetical protein
MEAMRTKAKISYGTNECPVELSISDQLWIVKDLPDLEKTLANALGVMSKQAGGHFISMARNARAFLHGSGERIWLSGNGWEVEMFTLAYKEKSDSLEEGCVTRKGVMAFADWLTEGSRYQPDPVTERSVL